jgi:hypothetical protein
MRHYSIDNLYFVHVYLTAGPTFIERLPPTSGALSSAADATKLSCRVECYPLCQIDWFRNGLPIRESPMYTVIDSFVPENVKVKKKRLQYTYSVECALVVCCFMCYYSRTELLYANAFSLYATVQSTSIGQVNVVFQYADVESGETRPCS